MDETAEAKPRRRGLWWKSLIAAWLALWAVGAVALALDVDIPDELGFPALILLWALIWVILARRTRGAGYDQRVLWAPGALGAMQQVCATFCVAILMIGIAVLILDTSGDLNRTGVSAGVVAVGVAVIGLVSVVGGRVGVPSLDASDPMRLVTTYRNRVFARLAWAEAPAILAFAGFLLLGGEAWVYGIGLGASLIGFALAAPTRASVRREQEEVSASGSSLDLLEILSGIGPSGQR